MDSQKSREGEGEEKTPGLYSCRTNWRIGKNRCDAQEKDEGGDRRVFNTMVHVFDVSPSGCALFVYTSYSRCPPPFPGHGGTRQPARPVRRSAGTLDYCSPAPNPKPFGTSMIISQGARGPPPPGPIASECFSSNRWARTGPEPKLPGCPAKPQPAALQVPAHQASDPILSLSLILSCTPTNKRQNPAGRFAATPPHPGILAVRCAFSPGNGLVRGGCSMSAPHRIGWPAEGVSAPLATF